MTTSTESVAQREGTNHNPIHCSFGHTDEQWMCRTELGAKQMNRQRGYFNIDLSGLVYLAVVGAVAVALLLFIGVPYGLWWLWDNFDIVRAR